MARVAKDSSTGAYSFDKLFTYVSAFVKSHDYFVLNLETTLGGTDGRSYSTYPMFNSPDTLLDALKNMGVDCLLTANNHSYDTGESGFLRTVQKVTEYGFDPGDYRQSDRCEWRLSVLYGREL